MGSLPERVSVILPQREYPLTVNPSVLFINRPVATTLLTLGVAHIGIFAYLKLAVAPLPPQLDLRSFVVSATLPGASPEIVAAPLERHLGAIADVTEMTSENRAETTDITLRFRRERDSDGAARDVQAAINAARADRPTAQRENPGFFSVGGTPIVCLAMTSDTLTRLQIYEVPSTIVRRRLLQLPGIGGVNVAGASPPAVRVELNPLALSKYGIGIEDAVLASANANSPKGAIEDNGRFYQIYTNDQADRAADYRPLIIAYRDGKPVRLSDFAEVQDSVENVRNQRLSDGKPAVLILLCRQPGPNVIDTVDRARAILPQLKASIPVAIDLELTMDWTATIKTSLRQVQKALIIAVGLVIFIAFLFLRSLRATLIPSVVVPVSLAGTFG